MMTRRSKVWLVAAVLFSLVNLGGAVFAAAAGELLHAGTHVALLLLGVYFVRRIWRPAEAVIPALPIPGELTDRLTHLEMSVEAVAIEVERVGEGQRFMTRVLAENDTPPAAGEGAAEPTEIKAPEEAPKVRRS